MRFPILLATLFFCVPAFAQEALPGTVREGLRAAGVPPEAVSAVVIDLATGNASVRVNAAAPRNPASLMKLVVTYAALDALGPAYRWKTEVYVAGTRKDEALEGQLVLKGYGDPKLTLESLWLLARAVRERGIRDLRGDVVFDRSQFDASGYDPARFDAQPLRPYNVGPDALLMNFQAVRFLFLPDRDARSVRVQASPRPRELEVSANIRLVDGPCPDWRGRLRADFRPPGPDGARAEFGGEYPLDCGEQEWNLALLPPSVYAAGVFRDTWSSAGGTWSGIAREGVVPPGATLIYRHDSPALAEVVRDINKYSNNVMARQLFLTLGMELVGAPARLDTAQQAVKNWLSTKRLAAPELALDNGSGLSRIERISAQSLAALLQSAYASAVMPEFLASLPLVAVDGTMRRRLKNGAPAGQAHIKTGSLSDVRGIAGYVLDRRGRRHAVVMIVNHPNAVKTQAAQDALLTWVYEEPDAPGRAPGAHP